jgi:hypothetical protein
MPHRRSPLAIAAAWIVGLACSGPANLGSSADGGSAEGGDSTDPNVVCVNYASAKCSKFDSCTKGIYIQTHFGTMDQCVAREKLTCLGTLALPDASSTPRGYARCAQDISAAACNDYFDLTNITKSCTPQPGPRADGAKCVENGQCQSTWCYAPTGAACGTCAQRPPAGAPCTANVDCGGRGLKCSKAGICASPVLAGGACDQSRPCGFLTTCVGDTPTTPGTCQADGPSVGTACDTATMTASLCANEYGLFCPSATRQCATMDLVGPSQACGVFAGDAGTSDAAAPSRKIDCTGGGDCFPTTASKGTCLAPAAEGATCDTVNGPPCMAPARCVGATGDASTTGTCQILVQSTSCN